MGYIYISYSRQNTETAQRLVKDLQQRGYTVWIDTEDLTPGARWSNQIETAIREAEVFITLLSPAAQNRTIQSEIDLAHNAGKPIVPVLVEQTTIPAVLANHQIVNATGDWDMFMQRLVNAIDASTASLQIRRADPTVSPDAPAAPVMMRQAPRKGPNPLLIVVVVLGLLTALIIVPLLLVNSNATNGSDVSQSTRSSVGLTQTSAALAQTQVAHVSVETTSPSPMPTETARPTATTTVEVSMGEDSPTAIIDGTEIRRSPTIRPQSTILFTSTPGMGDMTATAIIARATAEAAAAFTETAEASTLSNVQMTATTLASLFSGMTATAESGGPRMTQTPLPGTGGVVDPRTEVAIQVARTVAAVAATENNQLSPAEAALIIGLTSSNNGSIFLVGVLAAVSLGIGITTLVLLLTGSASARPRPRPAHAHHHAGAPGQPQTVLPKMLLEDYQIFTSSSEKDKEWVRILVEDLEALGYAVWWYAKDAPGLPFGNEIRSAIYHTKVFLIVLSPDSMQSKHIEEEIRWAEIYDRPIIPVECRPTSIEERFYGLAKGADIDFTVEINYKESLEFLTQAIDHHLKQRLEQLNIEDSHDSD